MNSLSAILATMTLGNLARALAVCAACFAAAASATSNQNTPPPQPQYGTSNAPPPQQMDPSRALGLWQSTFGAVKIEADNRSGGLQTGALQGVWTYQRQGQEVIGIFWGNLRGNVLQFHWQEPDNPPLTGEGYLVFDLQGRQYSGRWWSDRHDRVGDWNGYRKPGSEPAGATYGQQPYGQQPYGQQPYGGQPAGQPNGQYGGQPYGGAYQPQRYPPQQPYPQQQQQPQQQPQPYYPPQQPQPQQPQQPYYPQQQPQQPQYPQQPQPQQPPPSQQPYY
jgi:hypothetical protein